MHDVCYASLVSLPFGNHRERIFFKSVGSILSIFWDSSLRTRTHFPRFLHREMRLRRLKGEEICFTTLAAFNVEATIIF